MIVKCKFLIFSILVSALLLGCDPGAPGDSGSSDIHPSGFAAELSRTDFNALPPEQQYAVANKLYATMFRGLSVEDFFDTSNGIATLVPRSDNFLAETRAKLNTKLLLAQVDMYNTSIDGLDSEGNPVAANAKYRFNYDRPRELPLARIKEYAVSNDMFVNWIAYFLTNTIMFSPALEMDAPDITDAQNMDRFLVLNISEGASVRDIIRANLSSLARWRVSRSAENHVLEAFELYLGKFNNTKQDQLDVYNGGIACKDLYLTSENQGYLIARTDFPNTIPQLIFGNQYVTNCDDVYNAVAGSPLLIPRVVQVIVNYMMPGDTEAERADRVSMVQSIVDSGATTFQEIFKEILFSREYLLNTERPKSDEENLMSMLDKLKWSPESNRYPVNAYIFTYMASNSNNPMYMGAMGWDTMSLKIGRPNETPLDSLSFANYHKSIREGLLMNTGSYSGSSSNSVAGLFYDENGDLRPFIAGLNLNDFIDFLFLNALNRKATDVEKNALIDVYKNDSYLQTLTTGELVIPKYRYGYVASVTYDYVSRLPEFYYFQAIN